jgi:hypothetical protein
LRRKSKINILLLFLFDSTIIAKEGSMPKQSKKHEVMNALTPFTADYVRIVIKGRKDIIGEVYRGVDDFQDLLKKGLILVKDAILPKRYKVPRQCLEEISYQDFSSYVDKKFKEALLRSNSIDGLRPGKLFSRPHADGQAWYEIIKVGAKHVDVEWRGYAPDGWIDTYFQGGGRFPKSRIEQTVLEQEGIRKLFTRILDV